MNNAPAGNVIDVFFEDKARRSNISKMPLNEANNDTSNDTQTRLDRLMITHLPESIFMINSSGIIMSANPSGWKLLDRDPPPVKSGRINAVDIFRDPWKRQVLTMALSAEGFSELTLHRRNGKRPYLIRIAKISDDDCIDVTGDKVTTCLYIIDTERREHDSIINLSKSLGLTPAETSVAILLAQGISDESIALQLGKKLTTVRSHVRSIISKSGVTSRAMFAHYFTAMV